MEGSLGFIELSILLYADEETKDPKVMRLDQGQAADWGRSGL